MTKTSYEFRSVEKIEAVSIYDHCRAGFAPERSYYVRFKGGLFYSRNPPLVSLAHPNDSNDGYEQLARLFAQADVRNIPRDHLFKGCTGAGICIRHNTKGDPVLHGIKASLHQLHLGMLRAADTMLGFYSANGPANFPSSALAEIDFD